ncbi:hypothetical protein A5760_23935 [Mycobacterium colombiense]|uniref:Uncharacterized protein n=1 Tax=Mycobacterium colombiense TaxID=339268 RepID=A0A1A0VZ35_9MYCO|nr:hypothetical protein [Mycobacterium colombiense]OBB88498.1 hypothetical protein A5760_23935 [Mycobacterium colombiense]
MLRRGRRAVTLGHRFPLILIAIGAVSDFVGSQNPELWQRLFRLTIGGMRTTHTYQSASTHRRH